MKLSLFEVFALKFSLVFDARKVGLQIGWLKELCELGICQSCINAACQPSEESCHALGSGFEAFHVRVRLRDFFHEECQLLNGQIIKVAFVQHAK